ncbi:MAG: branched-chain amino acid ABC transporter permease [Armatimonadetes bacterium]|nr:branched-chain amino acid ABC transporter permease [Armatimonadota bacterium]
MEAFLAFLVNGIRIGMIYAVVVTGYNLLALVTGMMHWAHTHLVVLAMYIAWYAFGMVPNVAVGMVVAVLTGIVLSTVVGPVFFPFIRKRALLEGFIVSLGIAIIVTEVMTHWLNAGNPVVFPPTFGGQQPLLQKGMISISVGDVIIFAGSILMVIAFFTVLNRTKPGLKLRAVAQDVGVAKILGISVNKVSVASFALAGFMGGLTAVFLALTLGTAAPTTGDQIAMKCLAILLFGSVGNLRGGLICAVALGVIESMVVGYLAGQWANAVAFTIIVLILLVKPRGVFGPQY